MTQSEVFALLRSLRRDHPDTEITTEHILIDERIAVFKATVRVPGGGIATGHGSEWCDAGSDYVERAESRALLRALSGLGLEAPSSTRDAVPDVLAEPDAAAEPEPVRREAPPASDADDEAEVAPASQRRPSARSADADERSAGTAPTPMATRGAPERRQSSPRTPVEIGAARDRGASSPTPFPNQPSSATGTRGGQTAARGADSSDQPPLEDYSWTAFWKWAREQGFDSKGAIEAVIGRQMNNLSPAEVRQLILAKRGRT